MVNMNKWEEIDFFDTKVGDTIKRVEKNKLLKSVIEGEVTSTSFVYSNATVALTVSRNGYSHRFNRQEYGAPRGVKIYRRKPVRKEFVFPTGTGAIIEALGGRGNTVHLVHLGAGKWFSLVNTGTYGQITLEATLSNLRVVTPGIVL